MMLAIHHSEWGFSKDWIDYCKKENIAFKVVNCYDSNIIEDLQGCDVLLWHHHHLIGKDKILPNNCCLPLSIPVRRSFLNLIVAGTLMIN